MRKWHVEIVNSNLWGTVPPFWGPEIATQILEKPVGWWIFNSARVERWDSASSSSTAWPSPAWHGSPGGGWNLCMKLTILNITIHYLTTPLAGSQAVWPWLNPPGDTVCVSPPEASSAASASSASLCFHAKLPAKLAFVPYPRASSRKMFLWHWLPWNHWKARSEDDSE